MKSSGRFAATLRRATSGAHAAPKLMAHQSPLQVRDEFGSVQFSLAQFS